MNKRDWIQGNGRLTPRAEAVADQAYATWMRWETHDERTQIVLTLAGARPPGGLLPYTLRCLSEN